MVNGSRPSSSPDMAGHGRSPAEPAATARTSASIPDLHHPTVRPTSHIFLQAGRSADGPGTPSNIRVPPVLRREQTVACLL